MALRGVFDTLLQLLQFDGQRIHYGSRTRHAGLARFHSLGSGFERSLCTSLGSFITCRHGLGIEAGSFFLPGLRCFQLLALGCLHAFQLAGQLVPFLLQLAQVSHGAVHRSTRSFDRCGGALYVVLPLNEALQLCSFFVVLFDCGFRPLVSVHRLMRISWAVGTAGGIDLHGMVGCLLELRQLLGDAFNLCLVLFQLLCVISHFSHSKWVVVHSKGWPGHSSGAFLCQRQHLAQVAAGQCRQLVGSQAASASSSL
ncbi:hypothetical protein D3C78_1146490 [compost metagenome]